MDVNSENEYDDSKDEGNIQETNYIDATPNCYHRGKAYSILSPSKKPDFHRNILSNSKSVSNSLNKNKFEQNVYGMPFQANSNVTN